MEFRRSASVSEKSSEVPVKALIAEEISHASRREAEVKAQAPNVVARLMGLDALSTSSAEKSTQSCKSVDPFQKVTDRLQHYEIPWRTSFRNSKSSGSPTHSMSDFSSSRRSSREANTSNFGSVTSQSHSHEQDSGTTLHSWKDWKCKENARMQALNELDVQLAAKQMLIKKKLTEAKLGLLSKYSVSQDNLYESKEYMDAMDFLWDNKDFLSRFLEEKDSLFANPLHRSNGESCSDHLEEPENCTRRSFIEDYDNRHTNQIWSKAFPSSQKVPIRRLESSTKADMQPSVRRNSHQALSIKAGHKHTNSSDSMSSDGGAYQSPTKIVVLKPGSSKARNTVSSLHDNPRSSGEFSDASEVITEKSVDVLVNREHNLQQDEARALSKRMWISSCEQPIVLRDPKQIAREIAKQVRETVTKDMQCNPQKCAVNDISWLRKMEVIEMDRDDTSYTGVNMGLGRDPAKEVKSNISGRGLAKKEVSELKKKTKRSLNYPFSKESVHRSGPSVLKRIHHHRDFGSPTQKQRYSRVHLIDFPYSNPGLSTVETDEDSDTDLCIQSLCEFEAETCRKNEKSITLLRSRSVPRSSSIDGMEALDHGMERNSFKPGERKGMNGSEFCSTSIHQHGHSIHYSSDQNYLGVEKENFGNKSYVDESEEFVIPCKAMCSQKRRHITCFKVEKVQHQIDDIGPTLESDSSVSSLDGSVTFEVANLSGIDGGTKFRVESTSPIIVQKMPANIIFASAEVNKSDCKIMEQKFQTPAGNQNQSRFKECMAADLEEVKDLSEQPSPMSVLDARFSEEPASPVDAPGIRPVSQGPQSHNCFLKCVDQKAVSVLEEHQGKRCVVMDSKSSVEDHSHSHDMVCSLLHLKDAKMLKMFVDGRSVESTEPELLYIRDLLAASDLILNAAQTLKHWNSSQPLGACAFERVEKTFKCKESSHNVYKKRGLTVQTRLLLFDIVNETLVDFLDHVHCHAWWNSSHSPLTMAYPSDLIEQIWSRICKLLHSQSEAQHTLASLAAEDLTNKCQWQHMTVEIDILILELETTIWNDLLKETLTIP
ncbi:hypothetical protein KP509_23G069400 [Ceratopteris richardii]|nr:hypothetical protein KP509_23G069400 [Ceratopteris richardii]KAH7302368.1 hypothetical protein KP509_23G069400 [Ceratopteris richardii]